MAKFSQLVEEAKIPIEAHQHTMWKKLNFRLRTAIALEARRSGGIYLGSIQVCHDLAKMNGYDPRPKTEGGTEGGTSSNELEPLRALLPSLRHLPEPLDLPFLRNNETSGARKIVALTAANLDIFHTSTRSLATLRKERRLLLRWKDRR